MKRLVFSLAGLALVPAASAEVQVNGFANLVAGMTLNDNESLYGYDDDIGFKPASLFALQVRSDISDDLSATAQLMGRGIDNYDVDFEWAYLTYTVNPNTSISAGRLRVPLFKYSSSLDVGYAYHWLTPPASVYDVDYNNIDGVRIDYQNFAGDWEYNMQLTMGRAETDTTISGTPAQLSLKNVVAASFDLSRDWFSMRALYGVGRTTAQNADFSGFLNGLGQFAAVIPNATSVAESFRVQDDSGSFMQIGFDIDKYNWFIGGEFVHVEVDDAVINTSEGWYVTAGLRLGKFTPHITFESEEGDNSDQLAAVGRLPSAIGTPDAALNAAWAGLYQATLGIANAQKSESSAVTVGLRYDYIPGLALKMDLTWFNDDLNSANDAELLRFGVNYMF